MSHSSSPLPSNPANAPSARFFGSVGIAPGARVLDVGCANGDLTRLLASIAGSAGEVTAIDRSEQALGAARKFSSCADTAPIHYHAVDLSSDLPDLGLFDAIVGRRVLMYLPNAAETLVRLKRLAKPGAIVAFQEHMRATMPFGNGDLVLHRQLYDWNWSTVAAEGGNVGLALDLANMMRRVGLSVEETRAEAILLDPEQPSFLPTLTKAMLPRMVEHGVATAKQVDIATLPQRIEDEQRAAGGLIVWDLAFFVASRA